MSLGWRFRQEPHVVRSMWMLMLRYSVGNESDDDEIVPFFLFSDIIQDVIDILTITPRCLRRIQKEIVKMKEECEPFLRCLVDEHDMYHWTVKVEGPPGTPYEDCWWTFDVTVPCIFDSIYDAYPFKPPKVMCVDYKYMFHPNIHPTDGSICMQTLKDRWSPQYTITAIMAEVRDLMKSPNFDVYVNHECGISYVSGTYAEKARELSSALRIQQ
eukprot:PhF_6_TR34160/c0_g1_i9/m.49939/K10573/UBE2A, UBC2, RAD6A; ubiquitin-conjugating enzyme E2 A